ncbi:MAG TPA: undecaprenyldiphospho-muramoylpentapeptide beta-N-acetylglucosaminyltransferase [Kofleriaceae bacterium]|jgi:UDP-N-acetylglucosamine--N-acetylmuramyl-(pentapeptide) pyrophosphoryl-undecaprenol N-acetylglucosamine transferase|nr:undecaprenyldiphospho-muramoylpentapeptide beta-N-acetylglucosaminyltransferase [Kofleriaceae bacterium]
MRLLIAGGGTGGHLFPGVAIAEELRAREPGAAVRFVGTRRGIEARVLPELGWDLSLIEVSGLKTVGALGALRGLLRLPRALWQARRILREFRPDAVIGVGGYASGPVVLVARLAGIPTAICEQNSIPGLTNKILGRIVRAVFVSFDGTRRFFQPARTVVSGNPVRRGLVQKLLDSQSGDDSAESPAAPSDHASAESSETGSRVTVHVLVSGGSLGAVAVNPLAADALIALARESPLAIVHQTGDKGLAETVERYRAAGVAAECHAFIKDMAAAYHRADVILSRAGATTVAELAITGKPAVFIPYPFAADNHQELNARAMADAGAALMFRQAELTADKLASALRPLVTEPARRAEMGARMKAQARPAAAAAVIDWCESQQSARGTPSR